MTNKNWFAIQRDNTDDWGTGSFDFEEAVNMAKKRNYPLIAEIDGGYDEDGNPTTGPICVEEYRTLDYVTRDDIIAALKNAFQEAYQYPGHPVTVWGMTYLYHAGEEDAFLGGYESIEEALEEGDFEGIADKILSRD